MLFGDKEQRAFILETAKRYADSIDVKLVFGAMVSSISKNCHYSDSDYDAAFLYLERDFPHRTHVLSERTEGELIKKCYAEDEVFEWIPFWEATAFLYQLADPFYKMDANWYHVNWVFMSPYTWDPYGIQNRLLPLMNRIFEGKDEIAYRKEELRLQRRDLGGEYAGAKKYLRAVHAAATIEWCFKYSECPPMDLQSLLYGLNRERVWEEIGKVLDQARSDARTYAEPAFAQGLLKRDFHRPAIMTPHNALLLEYIDRISERADSEMVPDKHGLRERVDTVELMYKIVYRSVFQNEPLLYRGAGKSFVS